ncbi:MAG: Stp1/IreP family PP2C-type Ser/Thr phosphatase [Oscillospiraceae bacterium]|nr:Stp1/IreP family PP2C-type Ser/Thr phosphatase [Oscillospiraceae bacterium]MBQ5748851.1 Stp1/IreP family PP2C-type Ser/Thr phosphatase [Oscillospiraceae bacterium]
MQIWGLTDVGNLREQNQDAYAIVSLGYDRALVIVCDGMGGAKSGNVASTIATETFSSAVKRLHKGNMNSEKASEMLKTALAEANTAVYEAAQSSADYEGMGTTLVAAYLYKAKAVLINVGDSRAYHFSNDGIKQVTVDHSVVEAMVRRGEITSEQAKNFPGKNIITRAVGTEPTVEGDVFVQEMKKDECLLLCSDGLSNEMADQEMLFEVVHGRRKSDCCERLLSIAKNRGAPDNVTVALAVY